jgi:hypothetical protein
MSKGIFVEGVKRSGKSKLAVDLMSEYIKRGCKVATNLDLFLENLDPKGNNSVIRLPDHPRSCDFLALGSAYPELDPDKPETYDEKKNGVVLVDELLTFLNSRDWKEKDRPLIVNWMVQMGKYGWDFIAIGQDFDSVDKQLRATTINTLINVKAGNNYFGFGIANTLATKILSLFGSPQFSIARFYDSQAKARKAHGHEFYQKKWTHQWYKTAQRFEPDNFVNNQNQLVDMRASYSMLSGKILNDWYPDGFDNRLKKVESEKPEVKKEVKKELKKEIEKSEPILKKWHFIALAICAYVVYDYVSSSSSPVAAVLDVKSNSPITAKKTKVPLPDVIKNVYITCSVRSSLGTDYCFERDGFVFYPSDIEIPVVALTACTANLVIDGTMHKVRCNPVYVPSWSSAKDDSSENLLASND